MKHVDSSELVSELSSLYQTDSRNPFPYAGCRKLLRAGGGNYEDLIPDLNTYFYNIASHSGGVKKILKWPKERLLEARKKLEKSFFEVYPEYKPLEIMITKSDTPDLYEALALHERARMKLLDLLSQLLKEQPSPVAA
ncbi:MAG: YxiJ-like family protein [Acidobacteriota bacterium]|nr:YxiJ-like family protein [Acidobacteriota bacterium]